MPAIEELKQTCQHCKQSISYPAGFGGHSIDCPNCRKPVFLAQPNSTGWLGGQTSTLPDAKFITGEHPAHYLARVRRHSCYRSVRVAFTVLFFCLGLLGVFSILGGILQMLPAGVVQQPLGPSFIMAVFSILGGVFWVITAVMLHRLSMIGIDAVDVLIDQGRAKEAKET